MHEESLYQCTYIHTYRSKVIDLGKETNTKIPTSGQGVTHWALERSEVSIILIHISDVKITYCMQHVHV